MGININYFFHISWNVFQPDVSMCFPNIQVSNAFLRQFKSSKSRILLSYVKEMPKAGTRIALDLSELLGPLLYSWVVQLLLPVSRILLIYFFFKLCKTLANFGFVSCGNFMFFQNKTNLYVSFIRKKLWLLHSLFFH